MYHLHYNFSKPPFENIPDPDMLYMSPKHERALSILRYALMSRTGFCVITGNVGAGKTTLLRSVLYDLDSRAVVGLVSNTQCESFEELLRWVLLSFDLEYRNKDKVEMYDDFIRFLLDQYDKGNVVTLIIDEAQHLGLDNLEQLRMLSNVNTERGQILQTILVGQPELNDLLQSPEIQQFAQRISYDYFLGPLDSSELVEGYIKHRLQAVGGREDLFRSNTYELIYKASGGTPRLINLICDTSLVYGYAEEAERIDKTIVIQVLKDKKLGLAPIGDEKGRRKPLTTKVVHSDTLPRSRRKNQSSLIERAAMRSKDV